MPSLTVGSVESVLCDVLDVWSTTVRVKCAGVVVRGRLEAARPLASVDGVAPVIERVEDLVYRIGGRRVHSHHTENCTSFMCTGRVHWFWSAAIICLGTV